MFEVSKVKILVLVSATSTSMIGTREEALKCVPYIHHLVQIKRDTTQVQTLINSKNEINIIYPTFTKQLGLPIQPIDVRAQKVNGTILDIYGIVVATFSVVNKINRVRFFEKTFLVANTSLEVVLRMLFLTLSDADIDFPDQKLRWRTYTTEKAFPTTRYVELVRKKEFAVAALDPKYKTFVIHVAFFSSILLDVRPQISGLIVEEISTKASIKYSDFVDIFSPDLASKLPKYTGINDHAIKLVDNQQPPYRPIYRLRPVELKMLKAYIKTNLANGFIRPSKSPAGAPILFDQKSDGSLRLYVNYQGLNNLIIKNLYPLPLIEKSLDRLRRARRFTQLDFTLVYHWMRIHKKNKWKTMFKTQYGHFEYQVMLFGLTNAPASF